MYLKQQAIFICTLYTKILLSYIHIHIIYVASYYHILNQKKALIKYYSDINLSIYVYKQISISSGSV